VLLFTPDDKRNSTKPAIEWYSFPLTINETAPSLQLSGTIYL
jgi:hypothetical protein